MRRRQRHLNRFGEALEELLAQRQLTNTEFCRLTGERRSTLSNLKHRPPTKAISQEDVEAWGRAIGLNARQVQQLYDAAQLAFAPAYVQDLVDRLRRSDRRPSR